MELGCFFSHSQLHQNQDVLPLRNAWSPHALRQPAEASAARLLSPPTSSSEEHSVSSPAASPEPVAMRPRTFKWDTCGCCPLALSPYILASGPYKGLLTLMCNCFWKRPTDTASPNERRCWWHSPKAGQAFPMNRFGDLPEYLKDQYRDVRTGLQRNGR